MSSCPAAGAPHVVFPSEAPGEATGQGAIVWPAAAGCTAGTGAMVDQIPDGGPPGQPRPARSGGGGPLAPLQVSAGPHGLIAIAGSRSGGRPGGVLIQGLAGGPFATLPTGPVTAPTTLATGYLGDLGVLGGAPAQGGLGVELERWYARTAVGRAVITGRGAGRASVTALALDYRSDALAVWAAGGELYARDLPASGHVHAVQHLGPAGEGTRVAALLSDDNRAIVMWSERSSGRTQVHLDYSRAGVRFGPARLLESFQDPDALLPPGSPLLVRLSSESVMAAWAGSEGGHWVLRAAPIDQTGLRTVTTIAAPSGDALLDALAPGPRGEAEVLWGAPLTSPDGEPDPARQSLMAARGVDTAPGIARFGPGELVAPPGPLAGATVAIEPASDRAIAAWVGEDGAIRWSARSPAPGA